MSLPILTTKVVVFCLFIPKSSDPTSGEKIMVQMADIEHLQTPLDWLSSVGGKLLTAVG